MRWPEENPHRGCSDAVTWGKLVSEMLDSLVSKKDAPLLVLERVFFRNLLPCGTGRIEAQCTGGSKNLGDSSTDSISSKKSFTRKEVTGIFHTSYSPFLRLYKIVTQDSGGPLTCQKKAFPKWFIVPQGSRPPEPGYRSKGYTMDQAISAID